MSAPGDSPPITPEAVDAMRDAYGRSAATWAAGPALIYRRLADELVHHARSDLAGRRAVDLGAGTGVLSMVLRDRGARTIAVDLAWGMLAHDRQARPPGTVADAMRLPLRTGGVDAVGAAFSLTHVPDPDQALAEIRRVTRTGGELLASSYHADNAHPAKAAVDDAAQAYGFEAPDWHQALKVGTEPIFSSVDAITALFGRAGFTDTVVRREQVDVGIDDPVTMVKWRLGMASLAPFVAALDDGRRAALVADALERLGGDPVPYRPDVIFVSARVP